jgi:hypothetical protein
MCKPVLLPPNIFLSKTPEFYRIAVFLKKMEMNRNLKCPY